MELSQAISAWCSGCRKGIAMTIRNQSPRTTTGGAAPSYSAWPAVAIAGAVLLGIAIYALSRDHSTTTTQMGSPETTGQSGNQASPQGPTGPLNTGSGGSPAEKPEGETPPNMQV